MKRNAVFVLLVLLLISCKTGGEKQKAEKIEHQKQAAEIGEEAARQLVVSLKSELQKAMKEGGPLNAVDYCNTKAIPLTREVESQLSRGMQIKRTSLKVRNPANTPDSLERAILKEMEVQFAQDDTLPNYRLIQQREQKANVYHYFKPMKTAGLCLSCHGDKGQMSDELVNLLEERYPNDRATGYQEGDLRGVIHVTIPEAVVKRN